MREMQLPASRPEEADAFRAAGKIAGKARKLGATMIHPGIRLEEVILEVEAFIRSQGAGIGFPAQTSRNHVAAHYCPRPGDPSVYCENDVAKLDVGVVVDGYLADTAQTVHLGDDPRLKRLIDASASALAAAIAEAKKATAEANKTVAEAKKAADEAKRVAAEANAALEEDEVWDEYDDLIENDDTVKVPVSATSSHGVPFQYESYESRRMRKSKVQAKESPTLTSAPTIKEQVIENMKRYLKK